MGGPPVDGHELTVEIRADLDLENGRLQVTFSTLDPLSGLPPEVTLGFLPPEDGTGRGQGHVSYRVRPKAGLPSGTEIFNVAQITFDFSVTIATDQVDPHDPSKGTDPAKRAPITLDAATPASQVQPLPPVSPQRVITLAWDASDEAAGSGIAAVDLFVSANNGPWTLLAANLSGTQTTFTGEPGNSYAFYSIAQDYAGHIESAPELPDASTAISTTGVELGVQRDPQDGSLLVSWPTAVGHNYTLLQASLLEGPWNPVPGFVNLPGTGNPIAYPVSPLSGVQFYRLELP